MSARFQPGQPVKVRAAFPPGHVRTPYYCRGRSGTVDALAGTYRNPEEVAYGRPGASIPLYRVRFRQADLWPEYAGNDTDNLIIDIFEHWLDPVQEETP